MSVTTRTVIVSGYFSPLHIGHLRMIKAARLMGDRVVVVVNNDAQQVLKKGRVIIPDIERLEIVENLRCVDVAVLAVDDDPTVRRTLEKLRAQFPDDLLVFANGGDRSSADAIAEADVCARLGIEVAFGVGGDDKADSSSRLISELGL